MYWGSTSIRSTPSVNTISTTAPTKPPRMLPRPPITRAVQTVKVMPGAKSWGVRDLM